MTEIIIAYWKDIPASVSAGEGKTVVRVPLSSRFQQLIDTVAMRQGLTSTEEYLALWEKRPGGSRVGAPREVAEAVAAELEITYEQIEKRYMKRKR